MKRLRPVVSAVIWAALGLTVLPLMLTESTVATAAEAVRPEIGKPLQEADAMMKAGRFREALARIRDADAVGGKTPAEIYLIDRTRGSAAVGAGDANEAAEAFEAVMATGRPSAVERQQMAQAVLGLYYRNKDYAHAGIWVQRYIKEGGTDPAIRNLLVQLQYMSNDCSAVQRELGAATDSGRAPSEENLQLLANCYSRQGDKNGYASAMERLVSYYPKKEYWADLLNRVQAKPGFSDRLDLDLYRLKLMTGNLTAASDYLEMAQLDLSENLPEEAKKVLDQGYSTHVLGVGADANRHQRLRDLVAKTLVTVQSTRVQTEADAKAAADGNALVNVGFAYVTAGAFDKGVPMMEQGIAKDSLKRPEDAKLHLGEAYVMAGKRPKGREIFKTIRGTDGTGDIARLWLIYSGS